MSKPIPKTVMPIIAVDSVDDLRTFYVDTLGFEHSMGVLGKDGQLDFCTLALGGARMMFARAPKPAGDGARRQNGKQPVEIYLEVADVQEYHDQLRKKKVAISDPLTMQWWGDRTFKVIDPAGYEIWFHQTVGEPKPPAGAKIV